MSLINEALKKAQRQRAPEAGLENPGPDPGEVVVARAAPRSARSVALVTLGSGVTVLAAALLTYFLTTGSATIVPNPARPSAKSAPTEPKPQTTKHPEGQVVSPTPTEPAKGISTASEPRPAAAGSGAAVATNQPPSPAPESANDASPLPPKVATPPPAAVAPTATGPAPAPAATPAPATLKPSEQVQAFVDAVRVMGIRASGDDSRVLMNGRQYRLNDVVDRNLGVRLVKVEGNCLSFADPNGVIYVKFF